MSFEECCADKIRIKDEAKQFREEEIARLDAAISDAQRQLDKARRDALSSARGEGTVNEILGKAQTFQTISRILTDRQQRKKDFISEWDKRISDLCKFVEDCRKDFQSGVLCSEFKPECCSEDNPIRIGQVTTTGQAQEDPGSIATTSEPSEPTPETKSDTTEPPSTTAPTKPKEEQPAAGDPPFVPPDDPGFTAPDVLEDQGETERERAARRAAAASGGLFGTGRFGTGLNLPVSGSQSNNRNALVGGTNLRAGPIVIGSGRGGGGPGSNF